MVSLVALGRGAEGGGGVVEEKEVGAGVFELDFAGLVKGTVYQVKRERFLY